MTSVREVSVKMTNYERYFGTPELVSRTVIRECFYPSTRTILVEHRTQVDNIDGYTSEMFTFGDTRDLLEWLKKEAEE